jgi:hypothetical protein
MLQMLLDQFTHEFRLPISDVHENRKTAQRVFHKLHAIADFAVQQSSNVKREISTQVIATCFVRTKGGKAKRNHVANSEERIRLMSNTHASNTEDESRCDGASSANERNIITKCRMDISLLAKSVSKATHAIAHLKNGESKFNSSISICCL